MERRATCIRNATKSASLGKIPLLLAGGFVPGDLLDSWTTVADLALEGVRAAFARVGRFTAIRLHGDCHSGNVLWTPARNVMFGGEFQWGHRDNFGNDFHSNDYRLQFSLKYSFSQKFGGTSHDVISAQ